MMEYKGYTGRAEFDADARIFHGEIIGTRDVITFQGTSVDELEQAFRDSIDDYLNFCADLKQDPDKPFSGQFPVRVAPELHRRIYLAAQSSGTTVNAWVRDVLHRETAQRAPDRDRATGTERSESSR